MTDACELFDLCNRRERVLARLTSGPATRGELDARLDVSRSTVDRAVSELAGTGLIEDTDDGYRLTPCGRVIVRQFRELADRLDGLDRAAASLADLPADAPFSAAVFEDAAVRVDEDARERRDAVLRAANAVRGCLWLTDTGRFRPYSERVETADLSLVLPAEAAGRLVASSADAGLSADGIDVRATDDPLPYSLFVIESGAVTCVCVGVHADGGSLRALVESTAPAAVEWATERVDREWAAATELS